jgi:cobalt/nickel transport system ATP-binding protein
VLDGLDLVLHAGERVAVSGPNGSGKTTLLHLIPGLLRPTAGSITVLGRACTCEKDFQAVRGPVGLQFQDADDQLFCPTVAEDVAFGPLNLGRSPADVRRLVAGALAEVGLTGYDDRVPYRLSTGEKRLVGLAAVLAMEPRVLLLDEPVAGLDEPMRARVLDVLCRQDAAQLVVSHDAAFRRGLATRALVLDAGRLTPA